MSPREGLEGYFTGEGCGLCLTGSAGGQEGSESSGASGTWGRYGETRGDGQRGKLLAGNGLVLPEGMMLDERGRTQLHSRSEPRSLTFGEVHGKALCPPVCGNDSCSFGDTLRV